MSSPYRILFLIDALGMGGAERILVTCLQHLDKTAFEPRVCVFGIRDGNPLAAAITRLGIPVDLLPIARIRDLGGVLKLLAYLRRNRIDLVHTQLETVTIHGGIAARISGLPAVHTLHTFGYPNASAKELRRMRIVWWALRRFHDRIIAVSAAVGDDARRNGGIAAQKLAVIYNGIDTTRYVPRVGVERLSGRSALGIPAGAKLVITVAVLRREKGIQTLIEAWPSILRAVPDAYYLIVGDGAYRPQLDECVQRHAVAERVIFAGERSDIPELLAGSDLFVLPTLDDVLPTVLAEAMASSLPIVASRVGGVPEMVEPGRNGLLVPPADRDKLAEACIRLLRDPKEAQALGRAGREMGETRFNVRVQVRKLEDLYRQLLAGRAAVAVDEKR
jgi:glycosyltransferase involved in cell wall biosynthesis